MEIKFKLETLGYMTAEFLFNNKSFKIGHSSDYGDRFQELLNKIFIIYEIIKCREDTYLPYNAKILWEDDFVNYEWSISIDSLESDMKIEIYELSSSNTEYKVELINERIKVENLFKDIYLSLNHLFVDFGFVGYKKNWEVGNFPIYEYIILKAAEEKIILQNDHLNKEEWKQKIDLFDELKVINNQYWQK